MNQRRTVLFLAAVVTLLGAVPAVPGAPGPEELESALPSLSGAERAAALTELATSLRDTDPDKAIAYGTEAAALLEDHPLPEREIELFLALAGACFHRGDMECQLAWAEQARAVAETRGDAEGRWRALLEIAEVEKQRGEFDAALDALGAARRIVEDLGDPAKLSRVLDRLGNVYQRQGHFSLAMESLLQALEIERRLDDPAALAQVLRDTARVYESIEDYRQSLAYLEEALAITERLGDRRSAAFNRRNLANVQSYLGRTDEALDSYLEALAEAEALGDLKLRATLLNNVAELLSDVGRHDEALAYAERAVPAIRAFGVDRWTVVVLTTYARALTDLGRPEEAVPALLEASALAEKAEFRPVQELVHERLAHTYEAMGDYRRALEHHRRFKEIHDELFSEDSQKRLAELEARFDAAEKDREIAALEHQRALAGAELERHKAVRNAAVLGSALLLVLAIVVAASYRQKRRAHRRLQQAYGRLEATHQALVEQRAETAQERAVADRLREVDRLKDEFLANTSHELRTPLQGILGLAESLLDGARGELPAPARSDLAMVAASGRRLARLVDDILDFSKLKHGGLTLDRRAVDVKTLAEVVIALSRPLVGSKDLELVCNLPAALPAADADENRLLQILHNLVGNAIKFTESGFVEIAAERRDGALEVRVTDTGIGIAADQRSRIFEAFEQADASAERGFGGTGLGLAVTRQLVELHGGALSVESAVGEGSTFSFTLPISQRAAAPPAAAAALGSPLLEVGIEEPGLGETAAAPGTGGDGAPAARILIVDDEPVIRRVLANHLAAEGYRLGSASSGAEALRLLAEEPADLVLLDVMMPKMSGYEVCRRLREHHSLEELPVVFLTAKNRAVDLVAGLDAGANDYLTKPVAKSELLARVRTHLELLAAQRQLARGIHERQQLVEELEARNAELARFTYTVSHDLKSPLVTIKGFLGLLELDAQAGDLERMRHDIGRIQTAADRMRKLLEDLLELSRLGRLLKEPARVALGEVACEALSLVAGDVAARGVEVEVDRDLPVVVGDRLRLVEVFQNLIENAVKYMGEQPQPRVEVGAGENAGEPVVYVRDNGIGIEPRYHDKVFGLFERLDAGTEGTGVGLALVKRIVELHGGRIWVESEGVGRGSTFCFSLPPGGVPAAEAEAPRSSGTKPSSARERMAASRRRRRTMDRTASGPQNRSGREEPKMIEFVTLFLMLTWGVRPVEVAVGGAVAAVEVRLDGAAVGRVEGEPWSLEVDFGEALLPHLLEAVALDGDGRPVARTRQTINFGRSGAEASLVLDLGKSAVARKARVVWQTYDHSRPKKMRVRFDGRKVAVAEDGTIDLPPYDPESPHLLEAKLTFPGSLVAETELSFGGSYSETVTSELTAVPVLLPAETERPRPAAMAGWFQAEGEPVPVFSVEREPPVVFLVRDYNLPSPLPQATPEPEPSGLPSPSPPARKASADELLFIATTPYMSHTGPHPTAIFLIAKVEEAWSHRGLAEVARFLAPAERPRVKQQLFEAVALAARAAAASGRPRAVVLLLDPASPDFSRLSAPQTLSYLRSLRVPLFVWRVPGSDGVSFASGALDDLAGSDLSEVVGRVEASLERQHVVWLNGPYLPQRIELTGAAPDGVGFPF